ncbi:IS1595 family transposase [Haemophilus paracuniculus]|uniref:IS1595 family transposase n=1 Tax=Haemophilus paracuniculus TaxID=734 RepID=UPI000993E60D|nr:IS1595 family transposase [Haemophilus paracuniculus]
MMATLPLRQCAKRCEISLSTAFIWRHKILDLIRNIMNKSILTDVVQADETYTGISFKGNHKVLKSIREAFKRGTSASKRGLSKELACVSVAINYCQQTAAQFTGLGRPRINVLRKVLNGRIAGGSLLITDSANIYNRISNELNLGHIKIPPKKRTLGKYNIQKVNSFHSRFKSLIDYCFCGVATKYINNYIAYTHFLSVIKGSQKEKLLFEYIRNSLYNIKSSNISNRPAIPLPK